MLTSFSFWQFSPSHDYRQETERERERERERNSSLSSGSWDILWRRTPGKLFQLHGETDFGIKRTAGKVVGKVAFRERKAEKRLRCERLAWELGV